MKKIKFEVLYKQKSFYMLHMQGGYQHASVVDTILDILIGSSYARDDMKIKLFHRGVKKPMEVEWSDGTGVVVDRHGKTKGYWIEDHSLMCYKLAVEYVDAQGKPYAKFDVRFGKEGAVFTFSFYDSFAFYRLFNAIGQFMQESQVALVEDSSNPNELVVYDFGFKSQSSQWRVEKNSTFIVKGKAAALSMQAMFKPASKKTLARIKEDRIYVVMELPYQAETGFLDITDLKMKVI